MECIFVSSRFGVIYILLLFISPLVLANVLNIAALCRMRARMITAQPTSHTVHYTCRNS